MTQDAFQPSRLASDTVAALQAHGRVLTVNWGQETFDIEPPHDDIQRGDVQPTLGVVLNHSNSVVFYYVWEIDIDEQMAPRFAEFTARANEDLYTSALELNIDGGSLMLRAGIEFGDLAGALSPEHFTGLLVNALDECERAAYLHLDAVASLAGGASPLDALAKVA